MDIRTDQAKTGQKQRHLGRLIASAFFLSFSAVALAQVSENACGYEQDIIAYTDNVNEFRPEIETDVSRRYGAISAYLFAKYSDLPAQIESELYQKIDALNIENAAALNGAYQIFTAADTELLAILAEILAKTNPSEFRPPYAILRSALLRGQGRFVLKSAEMRALFVQALGAPHHLAYLVADQDDETRLGLADLFERLGMIPNAIAILQTLPDLEPLFDFLKRHQDKDRIDNDIWSGTGGYITGLEFALLNNNSNEYQNQIIPEDHLYSDPAIVKLVRGEQYFRFVQVLVTAYNMTNDLESVADYATLLDNGVISWELEPDALPFMALGGYLEYFSKNDPKMVEILSRLKQPYFQYDSTLELAQNQSAAFGFSGYILGTQTSMPQLEFLPESFDFAMWAATADVIKQGDPIRIQAKFQENARITAELLFSTNMHDKLAELLQGENTQYSLAGISEEFALRLDLRCEGYLNPPMSSMRWKIPMFRFGETN